VPRPLRYRLPGEAKPTKYRSQRTEYNGRWYASKAEAARAAELDLLLKYGQILWWIPQVGISLGCWENRYVVDFLVGWQYSSSISSHVNAEDVKGYPTAKFKRDAKLWHKYGPFPLHVIGVKETKIVWRECEFPKF